MKKIFGGGGGGADAKGDAADVADAEAEGAKRRARSHIGKKSGRSRSNSAFAAQASASMPPHISSSSSNSDGYATSTASPPSSAFACGNGAVSVPYDGALRLRALRTNECAVLQSKTMPLLLSFDNCDAHAEAVRVLYKLGDDLRRDALTLQMLALMNHLWLEHGLDLRAIDYRCVGSGPLSGFIEIVPHAATMASIHKSEGGGASAALSDKPLLKYLQRNNTSARALERAQENFVRSCAASCVGTYILGVGDRHNDNVMITRDGRLFHIDFGKFMGNVQTFAGISRDRSPFLLTSEMRAAMGAEANFAAFEEHCVRAFLIVRRSASTFLALFGMLVATGMPELSSLQCLDFLRSTLMLDEGSDEAKVATNFKQLIVKSLNTKSAKVNNMIHILAN